jgi:hypothetical protein
MPERNPSDGISRRRFLRDAGVATVATADVLARPAMAAPHRRRGSRPTVAVFGGGIAGLTAAHELAERGFDVTVYERNAWGGRARSTEIPGTASGGRKPLPGEHSFRVFLGFYQNIVDTMRRIPFDGNANGVVDNLVPGKALMIARDSGRRELAVPLGAYPDAVTPGQVVDLLVGVLSELDLPPAAVAHLGRRMTAYFASCDERRFGQWEHTSWTDFTGADRFSDDYRKVVVDTFGEFLVAAKGNRVSADMPAHILELLIYSLIGRGSNDPAVRFLNLPTNEAFINPWLSVLRGLGVQLRNRRELTRLSARDGRIISADVRTPRGVSRVWADWYVCALPQQRARKLLTKAVLKADPALAGIWQLEAGLSNADLTAERLRQLLRTRT